MKIALGAAMALALAACNQNSENTDNAISADNLGIGNTGAEDPATTNLDLNSSAPATDQAINRTDSQSDLANVADNAADSVGNSVQ